MQVNNKSLSPENLHQLSECLQPVTPFLTDLSSRFSGLAVDSVERRYVLGFWMAMAELYGSWESLRGSVPTNLWVDALLELGPDRARQVFVCFRNAGLQFPPSLSEFLAKAQEKPVQVKYFKRLPVPVANPAVAKAALLEVRRMIGGGDG